MPRKRILLKIFILTVLFVSAFSFNFIRKIPTFSVEFAKVEKHDTYDIVTIKSRNITHQMLANNPNEVLSENQVVYYPGSGYITDIIPEVIGSNSSNILHHSVLTHLFHGHDLTCPEYHKLIFAAGAELTPMHLPPSYGYPIAPLNGAFAIVSHFRNEPGVDLTKVHLQFKITVSKEKLTPAEPIRLDVDTLCNYDSAFSVDPNITETFKNQKDLYMPFNGTIIAAGGHLHKYSENLQIFQNDHKIIEIKANTNKSGDIINIPTIMMPNLNLQKGDKLDIKTTYTNPLKVPIEGMAIFFAYLKKE